MAEDLRVAKTKRAIVNAFIQLRSKKELEKITVKELCEKAAVNKSTFYTHFRDLYDLSDRLESQVAAEVVAGIRHPEDVFADPENFNRELVEAFLAQERLIHLLFTGSRSSLLPVKIEASLKEMLFSLRPELKEDAAANVLFTIEIYGGFYAFERCRPFGVGTVVDTLSRLSRAVVGLLGEERAGK